MKILVHSIYFPPEVGGLETHVLTLCQALIQRGHDVQVVTSHSMKGTPKYEEFESVPVHRVFCPSKTPLGWIITSIFAIPKMWHLSKNADVMHAHTFPSVLPCILPKKLRKIPLVATMHTSHFLRLAKKPFWQKILRFLLEQPDIVLAPSVEIRDVSLDIAPKIDAYALVNAVDVRRFKFVEPTIKAKGDEKIIVVPRRLFEKNGVEFAVRALPLVREKFDARLYLVGDGPLKEKLQNIAENLKISEFVHFLGKKKNIEMPGYLSSADVIVIPSLVEATSVAALESMACERVIAASNVGGLPEIVSEETGRLAEPGNFENLAEKIIELLFLPDDERKNMGGKARETVVEKWSTDSLAERIEKYYNDAVHKKP